MPRSYVTEVETNIKVGAHVQLGERTLIVGPPRSGKSTIVNAIEAAGSGCVSDVAGRALLAKDADLSTLGDSLGLFATARLSDGQVAGWKLVKGHRAQRTGPDIAFPLREVREAILGSPDKARRWILAHGDPFTWNDVLNLVPGPLQARLRRVTWDGTGEHDTADRLAAAIDAARAQVREMNARAKVHPAAPGGPPPTDEEIRAAEEAVARISTAVTPGRLDAVRAEIAGRRARIDQLETDLADRQVVLDTLPAPQAISDLMRSALTVVEYLANAGARQCLICGAAIDLPALRQRATRARAAIDEGLKADNLRRDITAVIGRLKETLARERAGLAAPEAEEKRLADTAQEVAEIGDPDAARAHLSELHRRRAEYQAAEKAEAEALQAEQEALGWQQLADGLSWALGQLVNRARRAFEARVQLWLPPSYLFGVELLDGDRQVLRIGLRSTRVVDGPVRAALSGVEWATVTAALALATAPEDGPVVVVPEDRAHSPETLTEVMRAFSGLAVQVVMTAPIEPALRVKGWTVIRTGPPPAQETAPAPAPAHRAGPGRPSNAERRAALLEATERARQPAEPEKPPEIEGPIVNLSDL